MQKINVPTRSIGRISLGLSTPITFELQLLDVAVKGKKAFESYLNKESPNYGIDEQVMSLEILQEIELWENDGNRNLLVERARDQVVRVKHHKSLHTRALVIYRDFLNLSLARSRSSDSTETLSSQWGTRESTEFNSSMERMGKEYSSSSQDWTLDGKFDKMLCIELPDTVDEESSSYMDYCSRAQGEASGSSCEILSIFGVPSCEEISIFDNPKQTDEGVVTPVAHLYEKLLIADDSEGRDSIFSLGRRNSHWSKVCSNMTLGGKDQECFSWDVSDVKIDLCNDQTPKALGDFPGKDFKYPIQWTIDGITYEARNVSELRSKHCIVTEGIFKKRLKCHTWRSYYGFFFNTGVMIYFKKDVFKKAADFRKSTVIMPKGKQLRLNIDDVLVSSRLTNWQVKFESAKHLNTWCKTVVKFSKGLKPENDGIRHLVVSPMSLLSKQI
jgi:hypothetical protein